MPEELKAEAQELLKRIRETLEGLLIEQRDGNRRSMSQSDFMIDELKRLARAIEGLARKIEQKFQQ